MSDSLILRRSETILVVDDNETVLNSVVAVLQNAQFRVLSANGGASAVKLAKESDTQIDLLLSDVNMPGMSGPDLGEVLKKARPSMHVMLMSGGADGTLLVLNYGWAFIQKAFVPTKLVEMVTDVLHSPNRSQLGGQEFDSRKDTKNPHRDQNRYADAHPATTNEPKDRKAI
jgi:two-component system cell cycle sensor histidine kinase/response regulator CckA